MLIYFFFAFIQEIVGSSISLLCVSVFPLLLVYLDNVLLIYARLFVSSIALSCIQVIFGLKPFYIFDSYAADERLLLKTGV